MKRMERPVRNSALRESIESEEIALPCSAVQYLSRHQRFCIVLWTEHPPVLR